MNQGAFAYEVNNVTTIDLGLS